MKRVTPLLFLVLASGCQTYESADLTRYSVQHGFSVSTGTLPANSMPMGIVNIQEDGFYFLGLLPIVTVSLQNCLDRIVTEAKKSGAHGIANVRYEVSPAYMLRFSVFGLPDWTAMVRVTGTAYRVLRTTKTRSDTAKPETIRTSPSPPTGKK